MGLVDLQTDLTSLRYGKDTVGGGWSGQPYIVKTPPNDLEDISKTGGPDFLLRGGTLFPGQAIDDVSRLTKMFFDLGSTPINGPLFIAKQNVLSLSNVDTTTGYISYEPELTEAPSNPQTAIGRFIKSNLALNQGIYTPLSTLAAAAGVGLGIYPNKQGLNPFNPMQGTAPGDVQTTPNGLTLPTYIQITDGEGAGNLSRLLGFLPKMDKQNVAGGGNVTELYSYTGGPGATLGVGKTTIRMVADQRTGANSKALAAGNSGSFAIGETIEGETFNERKERSFFLDGTNSFFTTPASLTAKISGSSSFVLSSDINDIYDNNNNNFSLITKTTNRGFNSGINEIQKISTWTQQLLEAQPKSTGLTLESFETKIPNVDKNIQIPKSPSYIKKNIESRVNLGNPGVRGNLKSYSIGKDGTGVAENQRNALDKITAMPLYNSSKVTSNDKKNDLVKFRIGVIDNKDPNLKTYIHFRAFINGFSDNYSANWGSQKFMGRAEEFYKYEGFDRSISMDWTVAAQSKQELIPMYQKLNYLASVCAPDYSSNGYMQGNLITLTVGGWCYEQTGIMTGLTLDVPNDSPWEIAINDEGKYDASVKELPMIINVSGFEFKPIHNFVPRVQQNSFAKKSWNGMGENFVETFGQERYLGLTNGTNSNYDNEGGAINYQAI